MSSKKCVVCGSTPDGSDPCILLLQGITEHTATPLKDVVGPALQQGLSTTDIICMRCLDLFNEKDRLQKLTTDMDSHIQTKIQDSSRKGGDGEKAAAGSTHIMVRCIAQRPDIIKNKLASEYKSKKVATAASDTTLISQGRNGKALPTRSAPKRRRGRPPRATQWAAQEPPPLMVNHREKRKRSAKFSTFLEVLKGEKEFYIEDEGVEEPQGKKRSRGRRRRIPGPDIVHVKQSREEGLEKTCIIQVTDMEQSQEKERLDLDEVVQDILGINVDPTSSLIPGMDGLGCNSRDGHNEEEEDLISAISQMNAEVEDGNNRESVKIAPPSHIKLEPQNMGEEEEEEIEKEKQQQQDASSNIWPQIKMEPGASATPFIEVTVIKEDLAAEVPSVEVTLSHDDSDTLQATISDPAAPPLSVPSGATDIQVTNIKAEDCNEAAGGAAIGVKKYRCKLCARTFLGRNDARQHAQECHKENLTVTGSTKHVDSFKCSDCERSFPTARGRDRHHLHMHLKHQPAQCPECPSTFNSFRPLERHLRNHHDKDPTLYCEMCEMEFVLGTSLEHHKEIMHPNIPNKTKVVRAPQNQKVREPEKQNQSFTCPLCKEEVVGMRAFRLHHQKKHKGCEYNCTYCNYKSACFSSINRHMVRVHKAFDMKLYNCQTCPARYSIPKDLEEHYLCVHNAEATLLCQHCGERFACAEMLRFHRNSHRAFSCKLCHLGFMKEEALEDHVKSVHHCDPVGGTHTENCTSQLKSQEASVGTKGDKKGDDDGGEKATSEPKVLVIASDGSVQVKEEKSEGAETSDDVTLHLHQTREGGLEEMDMLNPLKGQRVKDLPKKMSCPICNKVLTTKFLRTHMLSHKGGTLPHKCRLCDKAYAQGTLLRKHMKNRHYEEFLKLGNKNPKKQKVVCDFCQEIFSDIYALEEHLWTHMSEKAFECTDCKIKFGMESNLREHYKSHYFKEAKPCPVCQREFKSIGYYNDHVEKCQKRWKCEQCGLECDTQEYYRKHQRSEHGGENVVRYQCSLCEKSFVERHRYDDHMITHSSEKAFTCHICLKQFKRQRPLNDHLVRTHSNGLFVCSYCSKTFQKQQDLDVHKLKHKREFPCASCSRVYSSNEALVNHLMVHHSESYNFCHVCAEPFNKQIDLKNHLITHSSTTPHICQVDRCHKMFRSEGLLRNHVARRHHGLHYDCPVCDRKFSLESDQVRHTHSCVTLVGCEECQRTFRSEALLERHLLTHTQEKPYECGVCHHATSTRQQIMRHIQNEHGLPDVSSHVVVNRWRCSECSKMFVVKSSIMRHLQDHATHGIEAQGHAVKTRLTPSSNLELSLPSTSVDPAAATASFLEQVSSLSWQDLTRLLRFHVMSDSESDKGENAAITTDVWQCPGCLHATQTEDDMRDHLLGSSVCQEVVILQLAGGLASTEEMDDENSADEQLVDSDGNGTVLQLASADGGLQYVIMREEEEDTSPQRLHEDNKETQSELEGEGEMQVLVSMDDSLQQLLHQQPASPNIQIIVEDSAPLKRFLVGNTNDAANPTANTSQNDSGQDGLPAADASLLNGSEVLLQTVDGRLVLQQTVGGVTQYQLVEGVPTTAMEDAAPSLLPDHSPTLDEEFVLAD